MLKTYTCEELLKKANGDWKAAFQSDEPKEILLVVTPSDAEQILHHRRNNREKYPAHENKILRAMLSGNFDPTIPHCFVGFDQKGQMADALHRLSAQVRSGMTFTWRVALGMTEEQIKKLDDGRVRTLADRFQAFVKSALVKEVTEGKAWKSRQAASIANVIYIALVSEKNPSVDDALTILRFYRDSIVWVLEKVGTDRVLRRAAFMAAAVWAHKWASTNGTLKVLEHCMNGLRTGEMIDGSVLVFRKYLGATLPKGPNKAEVKDSQWVIFMKSLRAFQMILTDEPFAKMRNVPKPADLREWFLEDTTERFVKRLKLSPLRKFMKELELASGEGDKGKDES